MNRSAAKSLRLMRLAHGSGLPIPAYQSAGAAGLDLVAAVPAHQPVVIDPGAFRLIPTGFSIELPQGCEAQIRPRSGLAAKNGITVLNSPGTIDADYRGEIGVILINHGDTPFTISRGDRIAQMVVARALQMTINEVRQLSPTARGTGGFGSTGVQRDSKKKIVAADTKRVKSSSRAPGKAAKPARSGRR